MKNQIRVFAAVLSILLATFASAEISFQDTFNNISTDGDVNTETNAVGRQFGTLAPLNYVANPNTIVGESSIFPNKLALTNRGGAGVNHNFMESKNYTMEFDIFDAPYGGGDWVSFAYGKNSQIAGPNSGGGGLGILFRGEGSYQFFDDADDQSAKALPTMPFHVLVSVCMEDDSSTKSAIFINGIPINLGSTVALGTGNPLIYRKPTEFDNNNISFFNFDVPMSGRTGLIDNFTINSTLSAFYEFDWTDDADSRISSTKTYTHAVNLGANSDVDVNGVTFNGSSSNFSGVGWAMVNGYGDNNLVKVSTNATTVTGNGAGLLSDCIDDVYNQSTAIILSNLTGGQGYAFTLYNYGLGADASDSFFTANDSEATIIELNQNDSGPSGKLVKYYYIAPSNGIFSMVISSKEASISWNYYAFSNEESGGAPAGNVSATQGDFTDKIEVSWDKVETADAYQVYRNTTDDSNTAVTNSGEIVTNVFDDTTATADVDYYYWVKVKNTNGWSEISESTMGFCTLSTGPNMPTNFLPAEGAYFLLSALPVDLEMEPYSDPDGYPMIMIRWQIDNKLSFSSPDWDSGEISTTDITIEVPTSVLGATNYWRAKFKNDRNKWSEWSEPTSFAAEKDLNSPFYFYDTFNNVSGSGNVNTDYTASGRQYGKVIPVEYSIVGTTEIGDAATNPNELTLSGVAACSPNWSFEESGEFMIDVKITPTSDGSAITFGKASQNLPANSVGGFSVVFYDDGSGKYDVYDSTTKATFTNDSLIAGGELKVLLTASTESFDGDPTYITVTINNQPLALKRTWMTEMPATNIYDRWAYTYAYSKRIGFDKNFITFYNYGGDAVYDDLKVSTIKAKISTRTWENDEDTWIGTSNPVEKFTHAVTLNTNANITVAGLEFVGTGRGTNWLTDDTIPACSGTNWAVFNSSGSMAWWAQDAPFSGDSGQILENGLYGWSCSVGIVLSNLVPNSINVLNIYGYPFDTSRPRISYISGSDGGLQEVDENEVIDKGQIIVYEYTAGSDGTFTCILTPEPAQDYFVYGFSSYLKEITDPVISVVKYIDFSDTPVSGIDNKNLDVFNVGGGGVVSGKVSFATTDDIFSVSINDYFATPGDFDTIELTFAPVEEISYTNTLFLTGSGTNAPVEVLLIGNGVPEPILVIGYLLFVIGIFFARRK